MTETPGLQTNVAQQPLVDQPQPRPAEPISPTPDIPAVTASPEKRERKEVTASRKFQEAETITQVSVLRQSLELGKKKNVTDDERSVQGLQFLLGHKRNTELAIDNPIPTTDGTPIRISMVGGKFSAVAEGGMRVLGIQQKVVKDGQVMFVCKVEGNQNLQEVPLDEIIRSQIFAEGDAILRTLPENSTQRTVIEQYFKSVRNGQKELTIADTAIQSAATETGLFTTDAVESFVNKAEIKPDVKEDALKLIDGTNITDPETLGALLHRFNDIPERVDTLRRDIVTSQTELDTLRTQIAAITDTSGGAIELKTSLEGQAAALQAEIAGNQKQMEMLEQLKDAMPGGPEGIIQHLQGAVDGSMSVEQVRQMNNAMRDGKMEELMATLFDKLPKDHPEYEKFKKLQEIAKYAGLGIVAIIVIAMMQGMNSQ